MEKNMKRAERERLLALAIRLASMNTLDWITCDTSGHLSANGNQGTYWLMDLDWVYLELVNGSPAGPDEKKLGTFISIDDAKAAAERYDEKKEVA